MAFSTGPNTRCARSSTAHTPPARLRHVILTFSPLLPIYNYISKKWPVPAAAGLRSVSEHPAPRRRGKAAQVHGRWTALLRCLAFICYHCLPYWQLFKRLRLIVFDSCTHVIQTDFLEQCVFNCVCVNLESDSLVPALTVWDKTLWFTTQRLTGYAHFSCRLLKLSPAVLHGPLAGHYWQHRGAQKLFIYIMLALWQC